MLMAFPQTDFHTCTEELSHEKLLEFLESGRGTVFIATAFCAVWVGFVTRYIHLRLICDTVFLHMRTYPSAGLVLATNRESFSRTKELCNLPSLVLKDRHLGGSAF